MKYLIKWREEIKFDCVAEVEAESAEEARTKFDDEGPGYERYEVDDAPRITSKITVEKI